MSESNGNGKGLVAALSNQLCPDIDPRQFLATLKDMCCKSIKGGVSDSELMAYLMVCKEHSLNPILREVHPFRDGRGGFQVVVGVDGWVKLANRHPQFNGMTIEDNVTDGKPVSCTCTIHRKDREHPVSVTEWFAECNMKSKPWQDRPIRMLRHKATIQAIRYAFNFAGIMDPEEARQIVSVREARRLDDVQTAVTTPQCVATLDERVSPHEITTWCRDNGYSVNEYHDICQDILGGGTPARTGLQRLDHNKVIDALQNTSDVADNEDPAPNPTASEPEVTPL